MKVFTWDATKNEMLKRTRNVSFEDVVFHLERGDLLDVAKHPNPVKYPGQQLFVVAIGEYAYLVPFTESEEDIKLITVIPSRKATKRYLKGDQDAKA